MYKNVKYVSLFFLLSCFSISCVIVGPGEVGAVTDFGEVQDDLFKEGLHFINPLKQKVIILSTRVLKSDIVTEGASKDLQNVSIAVQVNWHIDATKANKIYQKVGNTETVNEIVITPLTKESIKATLAYKNAEEIITLRTDLKVQMEQILSKKFEEYHIVLDDLSLTDLDFSKEFNQAIESKQIAEQELKKAQYVSDKLKKEAEGLVNKAQGESEAQRLRQMSLTKEILQQEFIKKWDGKLPVYTTVPLPFLTSENLSK